MRVFVTGASGWIGTALVPELVGAGHEVVGLARSAEGARRVEAAGGRPARGDLDDLDGLAAAAADADAVVHLAFVHDFANFAESARKDQAAIAAIGDALEGSDKPFAIASGMLGLPTGRVVDENEPFGADGGPRVQSALETLALAERGVRPIVVRLAPTVHGEHDTGFVRTYANIAREKGVAGYPGDGANRWPAVHRFDAATLYRLAIEQAPPSAVLHGIAEEGIAMRDIAEAVGRGLDLPVVSIDPDDAEAHFGWLGRFLAMDAPGSNTLTRERLGWEPKQQGLLADLAAGFYWA